MTVLYIIKLLWCIVTFFALLYIIDLGLKQLKVEDYCDYIVIGVIFSVLFIFTIWALIAAYTQKIITFKDFLPIFFSGIMTFTIFCDREFLNENRKNYKALISLLIISNILTVPIFVINRHEDNMMISEALEKKSYNIASVYQISKCPSDASARHIHVNYYDKFGHIRRMKFYPELCVNKIEDMDPKNFHSTYIINKEGKNEIWYIKSTDKGKIRGDVIFYISEEWAKSMKNWVK